MNDKEIMDRHHKHHKPHGPFTEEHRRKLSEAKKGKSRKPFSAETRKKMSEAKKGKKGSKLSEQKLQELEQLQKDTLVLDSSVTYKRSNIAPNLMIGDDGSYYFIRPRQRNLLGIRWPTKMHNSGGYPTQAAVCIGCSVDENGKKRTKVINMGRLVLDAFNVIPANGQDEVDHINRNPYDNRLTNLRWATRQQNVINRDLTNVHEACRRRDKRAKENGFANWGEYMRSFRGKNENR